MKAPGLKGNVLPGSAFADGKVGSLTDTKNFTHHPLTPLTSSWCSATTLCFLLPAVCQEATAGACLGLVLEGLQKVPQIFWEAEQQPAQGSADTCLA